MALTLFGRTAASALLTAAVLVPSVATPSADQPAKAPDVEMRDAKGRRVRLSEFRGKVVLLDLWASWCAPCQAAFPAVDGLYREYRARGVEVIATNVDERRGDADRFLEANPHEVLVVFDPRARVLKAFGAPGVPSSYLIDRQGRIRYTREGYTADTVAQYRAQLDALLAEGAR